ncbi:MAG: hypothetical protein ACYTXY_23225, partial [Nostoc sp.]
MKFRRGASALWRFPTLKESLSVVANCICIFLELQLLQVAKTGRFVPFFGFCLVIPQKIAQL